jgi:hypothetical protein
MADTQAPDDDKLKTVVIIKAGERTRNGRVYPREVIMAMVNGAADRVENGSFFGTVKEQPGLTISIDDITHRVVRLDVDDEGCAVAAMRPIPNTLAPMSEFADFVPGGYAAKVDPDGTVREFVLTHVAMVPKQGKQP